MEKGCFLFRKEVIQHRLSRNLGVTRINVPLNYQLAAVFSFILLLLITLFFCCAETSEQTSIRGYLDSDLGVMTLHSEQGGLIKQALIEEGKSVKKGDTLFIISNPHEEKVKTFIANVSQRIKNLERESELKKEHHRALEQLNKNKFISTLSLKNSESALLELSNKIKAEHLELLKYQQSRYQFIKAPVDGVLTNIFYKKGQIVGAAKPLLQLIPKHSTLLARLYIPSKDIGCLKKKEEIMIKYDAYPSSRFGFYKAFIKEINLTVLTDDKEDKPLRIGQPYYKIKAELEQPYVNLYQTKQALSHGMTLTGIIVGEKRKMWQWVFDPIYRYYGDLYS